MAYVPGSRAIYGLDDLRLYVDEELTRLAKELGETTALENRPVSVAPTRPREGMIVFADGTSWDPGNGAGSYEYIGGVWRPLNAASFINGDRGDITVSGGGLTWTIDAGAVSNSKLANMATGTVKARGTAGTGVPEDIAVGNGLQIDASSISAKVQMSIAVDGSGLKLSGDSASPGNSKYYGTDSGGTKGWNSFPSAGLEFITSWVFSSGTSAVDFTNLSPYNILLIVFQDCTTPAATFFGLRTSTDNGSTFNSTAGDYDSIASDDSSGTTNTGAINCQDGAGSGVVYGSVLITGFNNSSFKTSFQGLCRKTSGNTCMVMGFRTTAEANNALRVTTGANLTGGTIHLYGQRG